MSWTQFHRGLLKVEAAATTTAARTRPLTAVTIRLETQAVAAVAAPARKSFGTMPCAYERSQRVVAVIIFIDLSSYTG